MLRAVKGGSCSNKCPGRTVTYSRKKSRVFRDRCFNMGCWPAISFGPRIDGSANSPFLFSVEGWIWGFERGAFPLLRPGAIRWHEGSTLALKLQKFSLSSAQVFFIILLVAHAVDVLGSVSELNNVTVDVAFFDISVALYSFCSFRAEQWFKVSLAGQVR